MVRQNVSVSNSYEYSVNQYSLELSFHLSFQEMSQDLTTAQTDMSSLSQTADLVSQSITLEGASSLKNRIQELKANAQELAEAIRHRANLLSEALAAR